MEAQRRERKPPYKVMVLLLGALALPFLHDTIWRCTVVSCLISHSSGENRAVFLVEKGRAYFQEGAYEKSEYAYRVSLTSHETTAALVELADLVRHRGRYAESERLFVRALAQEPENDWVWLDLGKLYRNMGVYEDAERVLDHARTLNPLRPELWSYGYAGLYKEMGRFEEAKGAVHRGIALDPSAFNYMAAGDVYLQAGDSESAISYYEHSLKISPKSEAYMGLGWAYYRQGDLDRAEEYFEKFDEMVPRPRGEIYFGLGLIARDRGLHIRAQHLFAQAQRYDRTILPDTARRPYAMPTAGELLSHIHMSQASLASWSESMRAQSSDFLPGYQSASTSPATLKHP